MAYSIRLPDGSLVENIPDNIPPEEAAARIKKSLFSDASKPTKQSGIVDELVRGGKQLASSSFSGIAGLLGSPEEAAIAGVKRGQAISQEAGEGPSLEAVQRAYRERGLLPAAGEALSQIPRALAGQGATIGTVMAGGRLGAMAGSAIAPGVGTVIGGALGAGASMLPSIFGTNIERQASEQMERKQPVNIDTATAGVAAVGQTALESAGLGLTLGKKVVKGILGIADDAALAGARASEDLVKAASRTLAGGVVRGAAVEMPVEIAQSVIERAQAGLDLTSSEALKEYGEAAYLAGLVGGPLGGLGRGIERSGARNELARQEEADRQVEMRQLAEAQAAQDALNRQLQTQQELEEEQQKRMARLSEGQQGLLFRAKEIPRVAPPAPGVQLAPELPNLDEIEIELNDLKGQRDRVMAYQAQAQEAGDAIGVEESQKVLNTLGRQIRPLQKQFDALVGETDRAAQGELDLALPTPAPLYTKQGELDLVVPPAPPEQPSMTLPKKRGDRQLGLFDEPSTPAAPATPPSATAPAVTTPVAPGNQPQVGNAFDASGWTEQENRVNKKTGLPVLGEGKTRYKRTDDRGFEQNVVTQNGNVTTSRSISPVIELTNSHLDDEAPVRGRVFVDNSDVQGLILYFVPDDSSNAVTMKMSPRAVQEYKAGVPIEKIAETEYSDAGALKPDGTRTLHTTVGRLVEIAPEAPKQPALEMRPGAITLADVGKVNPSLLPWFKKNIEGKTPDEVRTMAEEQPDLVKGNTAKAKLMRTLVVPQGVPYQEPTDAGVRTEGAGVEPPVGREAGQRGVEPDIPTGRGQSVEPSAPPVTTRALARVEPSGLDVTEQPTGVRNEPQGEAPPAVETPRKFVTVSELPAVNAGLEGRISPKPIAQGKPLYRETNLDGLDGLLRYDRDAHLYNVFVADSPDIAIGQQNNRGVQVVFRPDSLSGAEHRKPGTGELAGREYRTNMIAPKAVQSITLKRADVPRLRGLTRRALADFNLVDLGNGLVRYERKGLEPTTVKTSEAPTDGTKAAETVQAETQGRESQQAPTAPEVDTDEAVAEPTAQELAKAKAEWDDDYGPEGTKFSDLDKEGQKSWAITVRSGKPTIEEADFITQFHKKTSKRKQAKLPVATDVAFTETEPSAPKPEGRATSKRAAKASRAQAIADGTVSEQIAKLPAEQVAQLEEHYGDAADSEPFLQKVKADVIKFATEGARAVSASIRQIIRSIHAGVLSVAMIFNPMQMTSPEAFVSIPKAPTVVETTTAREVRAELPSDVKAMSEAGRQAYSVLIPALKGKIGDKLITIADKPSGRIFVFDSDGNLIVQKKTLYGLAKGDLYKGNNDLPQNRITPAGLFGLKLVDAAKGGSAQKTAGDYDFGKVFAFEDPDAVVTIMHSVWLKERDAQQRAAALRSDNAADSRYSFGCINVDRDTYKMLLDNYQSQMDGSKLFIVPDNQAAVGDFLSGNVPYDKMVRESVKPVTETVTTRTTTTEDTAKATSARSLEAVDRRATEQKRGAAPRRAKLPEGEEPDIEESKVSGADFLKNLMDEEAVEEAALEAEYPDGPFTDAESNVVAAKSVDPRLANYVRSMMEKLGLGNVRVLLVSDASDLADPDLNLHGSYNINRLLGKISRGTSSGLKTRFGPDKSDFVIYVRKGAADTNSVETTAHELGHIIQDVAFDTAPANIRAAVLAEFELWRESTEGLKTRELAQSVYPPFLAKRFENEPDNLKFNDEYLRNFREWFANNVARWATTDKKAVTIVDKFFKGIADTIKRFVSTLTGDRYLPAQSVADFLNAMGPDTDVSFVPGVLPTVSTGQLTGAQTKTDTPEFKQFFRRSKVVTAAGKPKVMYHGTSRAIRAFRSKRAGAIFVTPSPNFAGGFASLSSDWMAANYSEFVGPEEYKAAQAAAIQLLKNDGYKGAELAALSKQIRDGNPTGAAQDAMQTALKDFMPTGPNILPVYVRAENPFDFNNPDHLAQLRAWDSRNSNVFVEGQRNYVINHVNVSSGDWSAIESPRAQKAIRELGFDGFYVKEGGEKNLAVFSSSQIKSVYNRGTFAEVPEIDLMRGMQAQAQTDTPEFKGWFGSSKVVDENGMPLVVYHSGSFSETEDREFRTEGGVHFGTKRAAQDRSVGKAIDDEVKSAEVYEEDGRYYFDENDYPNAPSYGFRTEGDARTWLAGEVNEYYQADDYEPNLTAAYLSIKNPKRVKDQGENWAAAIAEAKAEGHDGIVYRNEYEDKGKDSYIAFDPTQIKSATGNSGAFDPNAPEIDLAYVPDNITRTSELSAPKPSMATRAIRSMAGEIAADDAADNITRFRTINVDASASVAKKISAAFDGKLRDALGNINPLPQLRQANDYGKLMISLFENGAIVKDRYTGLYEAKPVDGVRSAKDAFDLLAKWAKDNKLSFDDAKNELSKMLEARRLDYFRRNPQLGVPINKLSNRDPRSADAQIDVMLGKFNAEPQLKEVAEILQKMRERLVQQMYEAGRITEADRDTWLEAVEYVPFDRMEEFATKFKSSRRVGRGLASVGNLPEIIGSERREAQNVLDSQVKSFGWMTGQILNNDAALATLRTLERIGAAQYSGHNSRIAPEHKVRVFQKGEEVFYELPSRWDVKAFTALNLPKSWAVQQMSNFSNVLRTTVTALPPFALKQVTDDIQRAFVLSGVKNPYALIFPILKNFLAVSWYEITGRRHPLLKDMSRKGIAGEYDFDYRDPAAAILQDFGYIKRPWFKELLHRMEGITRASDLAVRAAIYKRVMDETGSELFATTKAREFINFRRRGAGQLIGTATATIPFFNAYVQSMDLLYRNATGTDVQSADGRGVAKRMFIAQLAKLAAFAALYAMAVDDEDDYKGMNSRTRNNNWIIPGYGKLPVPNELAAITKVPVETLLEYIKRRGTKEEMEAADATTKVLKYAFEQFGGRVVPIPTAIRPVIEAVTNFSFLGGRQLEGIYQRTQDPELRTTSTTTELAKAIGQASKNLLGVGVSPIMVDNFLNQWFGTTSATITMLADGVLNPDKMDRPLHKYFLISNYLYDPVPGRGLEEAYELREKYSSANTTLLRLSKENPDAAVRYIQQNQEALVYGKFANGIMEGFEQTRKFKAFLESKSASGMSQEDRQKAKDSVRRMENEIGMQVRVFKAAVNKNKGALRYTPDTDTEVSELTSVDQD